MPCHLSTVTASCRESQPAVWPIPVSLAPLCHCVDVCQRRRSRRHFNDATGFGMTSSVCRQRDITASPLLSPPAVFLAQSPMPVALRDLSCFCLALERRGDAVDVIRLTLLGLLTTVTACHGRYGRHPARDGNATYHR